MRSSSAFISFVMKWPNERMAFRRSPQMVQPLPQSLRRESIGCRNGPHRFKSTEDIHGGIRRKCDDTDGIRSPEKVIYREIPRNPRREFGRAPGPHPGKVVAIVVPRKARKSGHMRGIHGRLLPRGERRPRTKSNPCKKFGQIVQPQPTARAARDAPPAHAAQGLP